MTDFIHSEDPANIVDSAKNELGITGIKSPKFSDIRAAYKRQALLCHPDRAKNTYETNEKFTLVNAAYHYLLFTYCNEKFQQDIGISEIYGNHFYRQARQRSTKYYADFETNWQEFLKQVKNNNLQISLVNSLLKDYKLSFKSRLLRRKDNFTKLWQFLKDNHECEITSNLELFFELTIRHQADDLLDYFTNITENKKKNLVTKILLESSKHNTAFIKYITTKFNFTNEELLEIISKNQDVAQHFELFMIEKSSAQKLAFAINIVKRSPGAYRFLQGEYATNLEIITLTFRDPEYAVLLQNLKHLANNIIYALVNKFTHIKEYKKLDEVFAGPREPYYTYMKRFAAACPLIIASTVLLVIFVGALQTNPYLALLVCIPAIFSTSFATQFTKDFANIKWYEYRMSKILKNNRDPVYSGEDLIRTNGEAAYTGNESLQSIIVT